MLLVYKMHEHEHASTNSHIVAYIHIYLSLQERKDPFGIYLPCISLNLGNDISYLKMQQERKDMVLFFLWEKEFKLLQPMNLYILAMIKKRKKAVVERAMINL